MLTVKFTYLKNTIFKISLDMHQILFGKPKNFINFSDRVCKKLTTKLSHFKKSRIFVTFFNFL